ncbi:putative helicase (plasmid) [Fischerella sp. NIES-4106]|nr:putative helicase [Fischerella sp. NIES-4106]
MLRDYQINAKKKIEHHWSSNKNRVVAVMPCGAGKTTVFSAIANDFTIRNEGVLVVAHREELITQAAARLQLLTGIEPGIIKSGHKPSNSLIQVASIQTIARRKNYPPAGLVIIDECHHSAAASYRTLFEQYPTAKFLGVTATPRRIDGYGLSDLFDEMVVGTTPRQLIAEGYLCPYKLFGGFAKLGIYAPKGRDFTAKELEKAATKIKPSDVVDCWHKFCKDKKTILFAINVQHSLDITTALKQRGVAAEHIDGQTPPNERRAILERFRTGETLVLSNVGILTEGFDCPDVEAVQCARPTTSIALWIQMLGRALRPSLGKEYAVIVDQTDNWSRLGRPCDDREWSLAPVPSDENAPGARSCKKCHHVFNPMESFIKAKTIWNAARGCFEQLLSTFCPNCGAEVVWRPSEGNSGAQEKEDKEDFDLDVEFKEIPVECRFEVLERIGKIRKSGNRYRTPQKRSTHFERSLASLMLELVDMNLQEIQTAVEVLEIDKPAPKMVTRVLTERLQSLAVRGEWQSILNLMSSRPQDIKKIVWESLPTIFRRKIHYLKSASAIG